MRSITKVLVAFGVVAGAAALTVPGTDIAKAQGFSIDAPGFHARIGPRHHHHRYYREYGGYGAYAYRPGIPSVCGPYDTLQDGVCKPYRGY